MENPFGHISEGYWTRERGSYVTARMIDDYVYAILSLPLYAGPGTEKIVLPEVTIDGRAQSVPPTRINYFDYPDHSYRYTMIVAVNVQDDTRAPEEKTFLTGISQYVFASRQHIYLTHLRYQWQRDLAREGGRTVIDKLRISRGPGLPGHLPERGPSVCHRPEGPAAAARANAPAPGP